MVSCDDRGFQPKPQRYMVCSGDLSTRNLGNILWQNPTKHVAKMLDLLPFNEPFQVLPELQILPKKLSSK
jgi:hypothetical protein